jgi:hypothetical protein
MTNLCMRCCGFNRTMLTHYLCMQEGQEGAEECVRAVLTVTSALTPPH